MQSTSSEEYFKAYHARDRNALESLLSDDFAFCSPLDDNISKDQYLKTCWPNSEHQLNHLIEKLFVEGNEALATYECERPMARSFETPSFSGPKVTRSLMLTFISG